MRFAANTRFAHLLKRRRRNIHFLRRRTFLIVRMRRRWRFRSSWFARLRALFGVRYSFRILAMRRLRVKNTFLRARARLRVRRRGKRGRREALRLYRRQSTASRRESFLLRRLCFFLFTRIRVQRALRRTSFSRKERRCLRGREAISLFR